MARYIAPPPVSPFLKKLQKSVIEERRAKHGIFQNDPTSSYRIIHWNGGIEAISNCVIILVAWTILLFIPKREREPRYSGGDGGIIRISENSSFDTETNTRRSRQKGKEGGNRLAILRATADFPLCRANLCRNSRTPDFRASRLTFHAALFNARFSPNRSN